MKKPDLSKHPVVSVMWVPLEKVRPNDYNPNSVAGTEMQLLYSSIKHDGYTQPIVTVRHNRARGKHSVAGMSNMVFQMLENGMVDEDICNELGMEPEELLRLKHITGFSRLFENTEYKRSWVAKRQIAIRTKRKKEQAGEKTA